MEPIRYVTSLLTFYMKGEFAFDRNFILLEHPNTILRFIPNGSRKENIAINQISSVQSNFKLRLGRLLLGIFCVLSALSVLINGIPSDGMPTGTAILLFLILLIAAALLILNAYIVTLRLNMTSGQSRSFSFFIFDKAKAQRVEQQINELICGRLDDTNDRRQTDRIVEAINNK